MPDPFPSGVYRLCLFLLILKRLRSVPLMGGPQGPSVSRSPGTAPQKRAGWPMGPSTPLCRPQSYVSPVFFLDVSAKGFCFGVLFRCFALGKSGWFSEPFKLRALCCLSDRDFSGLLGVGGCIVTMTFLSTTGVGRQD